MAIDVNTKSETSPEDQDVLKRTYMDRLRVLNEDLAPKRERLDAATTAYVTAQLEYVQAAMAAAITQGKIDELRRIAALDGITLP